MSDNGKLDVVISDLRDEKYRKKTLRRNVIFFSVLAAVLIAAAVFFIPKLVPVRKYSCDFEKIKLDSVFDWQIYNYRKNITDERKSTVSLVDGVSPSGKCLKIENVVSNDVRIHKTFKVSPNSYYKITVSIKTENVTDNGTGANISGYNMTGKALVTTGTSDWSTYYAFLETGDNQKQIDLSLGLGGYGSECSGVAYFDNLKIEKVSKDDVPEGYGTFKLTPTGGKKNEVSKWFKILFVFVILTAVAFCFMVGLRRDKAGRPGDGLGISEETGRFKRRDVIIVLILTTVTALYSFIGMGSTKGSPNTYWKPEKSDEYVEVSFKEETRISRIVYYSGIPDSGTTDIEYYDKETDSFVFAARITSSDMSFYRWGYKNVESDFIVTDRVRVRSVTPGIWLNEVGFYDSYKNPIALDMSTVKYEAEVTGTSGNPGNLFDEQTELRYDRSYLDSTYFDEIYHPRTAYEQIHGLKIYEITHPPLGKVIMEFGVLVFGMNTFGWRFSGVLFGVMLVPLVYAFALKLFKKSKWAFVASFLMMFDFMRLAQTRLATIDTYACFFSLAMVYFMYDYYAKKSYERGFFKSLVPLFLSGLMFGLGAASKWTCLYTGAALAILFFTAKIREIIDVGKGRAYSFGKDGTPKKIYMSDYFYRNFLPTCGFCVIFFVIIPLTIYILSYLQYLPSNPGRSLISIVWDNQKYMYNYHSNLTATHSFSSVWYTWPLDKRPIWYYVGSLVPSGMRSTISSFGNPAVWWLGIPCLAVGSVLAWRNRDSKMGFLTVAYAMQIAPWILVNRCTFIYHYFSAFAFSIFFITYVFKELTEKKIIPKFTVYVYLAIVLLLFIFFYPVLTGMTVSSGYVESLEWLSSWQF